MTGDEVRQVFEVLFSEEDIDRLCETYGTYQADVLRSYLEFQPHVTRAVFYRWFDEPWE